jgi:nitrogen fixation NifU-like protein
MDALYRDYILDHYKRPRNFGELDPYSHKASSHNPLCGDELSIHVRISQGVITDLRFQGGGCAISQAAASIISEELIGMSLAEFEALDAAWVTDLLGIDISPTRRKCALLGLKVARQAVTGNQAWPE